MERLRLDSIVFRLPRPMVEELKALSKRTRIRQSEFLREAIADLLRHHADSPADPMAEASQFPGAEDIAVHVLVCEEHAHALRRLAASSRVTQSEYLREAVAALLVKYRPPVREVANG